MAPIFKNTLVGRDQLGKEMLEKAKETGYLARATRMLVGSLHGKRILLLSSLARWYLQHGLVITEIYQMVEYHPRALFNEFGESVSAARREGDVDPSKKVLADTSKLIGNSCYGKTITNKDRHRDVVYVEGHTEASRMVSGINFESLVELSAPTGAMDGDDEDSVEDEGFYEASLFKSKVSTAFCH